MLPSPPPFQALISERIGAWGDAMHGIEAQKYLGKTCSQVTPDLVILRAAATLYIEAGKS